MCINLNGVKWDSTRETNWFVFEESFSFTLLLEITWKNHFEFKSNFIEPYANHKRLRNVASASVFAIYGFIFKRRRIIIPRRRIFVESKFPPNKSQVVVSWMKMRFNGNLCQNKKIISGLLYTMLTWFTNSKIERKSCAKISHFLFSSER